MAEATNGAANVNGTPLYPNGSTNPPTMAGVGANGVGVHTTGTPMVTSTARMVEEDFIEDPVDKMIVKQYTTGLPIDQICRYIPSVQRNGMEYEFYSVDEKKYATNIIDSVSAVTDSTFIRVEDIDIFNPGDVILVKSVKAWEDADRRVGDSPKCGAPLRLLVTGFGTNQSNQRVVQVIAINGKPGGNQKTKIPAIPANTEIFRIGNASKETDMQGNIYSALPTKKKRFMQIFKTQVSWSTIMKDSDKEVPWTMDEDLDMAIRELRKDIERTYIFGTQGYTYDNTDGKKMFVYTCGGILEQMLEGSHLLLYSPNELISEEYLIKKLVHPIFLGNSGSATRYMFCGSDFVANIATLPGIQKQMQANTVERKFGFDWKQIQFMTWSLNMYQHPILDEMGMKDCAIVLDLVYVQKAVFRKLTQDILDLRKSGIADVDSTVITEISSICLKYPQTHALIYVPGQWNPGMTWNDDSSSSSSSSSSDAA